MARSRKQPVVTVNPLFKLLIAINITLRVVSLAVMVGLGLFASNPATELQRQLYSACETVFKMTAGAFIGLLGGKAASADTIRDVADERTEDKPRPSDPPVASP